MGLLDDAIREHLDLKRRSGADPGEVERLEREALGPVRRGAQEPRDIAVDEVEGATIVSEPLQGAPYADDADYDWSEGDGAPRETEFGHEEVVFDREFEPPRDAAAPQEHDVVERESGFLDESPVERESSVERDAPLHHEIAEEWDAHDPLDLQEPELGRERADDEPQTAEHSAAAPPAPAEAPPPAPVPAQSDHLGEETVEYDVESEELVSGDDDVLEETPEFLQDTPDHDRLWFEQKPPKDFDFDG